MKIVTLTLSLLASVLLMGCVTVSNVAQVDQAFTSDDDFRAWFAYYYQTPHPERLTAALKFMDKSGYLNEDDAETRDMPIIASVFLSRVFAANEPQLTHWVHEWQALNRSQWYVILVGLYMADGDVPRKLLKDNLNKVDKDHQRRLTAMGDKSLQAIDPLTAKVVSGRQINLLWSAFSATGDPRYVEKVIANVHFYGDEDEELRLLGETALMSLANNALQHDIVNKLCIDANAAATDPKTRVLLSAMLSAVSEIARDNTDPHSISH